MIKLLSRQKDSKQSDEINADVLVQDIADAEASNVSGGWGCWILPWWACRP